ncbi:PE family protein [Mycobacterium leprae]|uniref:PE family protein n=1 Tax=Mycobacterium leprae TaxID=1769 RepID=A0AAD0P7R0_MYCLR|nr:PE family protein [Mycobacterium leprae]
MGTSLSEVDAAAAAQTTGVLAAGDDEIRRPLRRCFRVRSGLPGAQ